ncbi:MAG: hypothetical protein MJ212_00430 [Alphaproteobacteria bacterium]|nr:hypothetical protein [Alphaproteobacteria bacterium]
MAENDIARKCPEYCPFLKANNTFCGLFGRSLQASNDITIRCEECKNPEQRMSSYKALGLSIDDRSQLWQKAIAKHNEIELGKKREQEAMRKKFAAFLEDKYGNRPPLDGNTFLKNLIINLYMVLDSTERDMMMAVLKGRNGDALIQAIERAPKDDSLLRSIRRELDEKFQEHQIMMQRTQRQNENINFK